MTRDDPSWGSATPDPSPRHDELYGQRAGDARRYVKPALWGVLAVLVVVFVVSNFNEVTVSFVVFQVQIKLFWALVLCVVLGGLLSEGFRFWRRRRRVEPPAGKPKT